MVWGGGGGGGGGLKERICKLNPTKSMKLSYHIHHFISIQNRLHKTDFCPNASSKPGGNQGQRSMRWANDVIQNGRQDFGNWWFRLTMLGLKLIHVSIRSPWSAKTYPVESLGVKELRKKHRSLILKSMLCVVCWHGKDHGRVPFSVINSLAPGRRGFNLN